MDVAANITPITPGGPNGPLAQDFPRLHGYRGAPKADVGALEDVLLRVSALVEAHPEIAEMDLNPLVVHQAGAVVVDARIRVLRGLSRPALGAH
jgi:acetate---CoA ligase (ADP-forming)